METSDVTFLRCQSYTTSPHSLGTLIEWKRKLTLIPKFVNLIKSPLAGDINWMETVELDPIPSKIAGPHSLGTLIEWKLTKNWEQRR